MTQRFLIRATGSAQPGQLAGLGKALATCGASRVRINRGRLAWALQRW